MTKQEWIDRVNETIANERNEYARQNGAKAYMQDGKVRYLDCKNGYERRITFRELLGLLHGEDMRSLANAR